MKSDKVLLMPWIGKLAKNVWNIISVELGWLACIIGAARGYPWLGLLVVPILFVIHIMFIERRNTRKIFIIALASIVIGFFMDTTLIILGIIEPYRWIMPAPFTTIWDIMIWINFSLALDTSLRFLQKRPLTAAFLGAIFAPGTYYAGDRLGALNFSEPVFSGLLWIGVFWFFAMPGLSLIAMYIYHPKKVTS
ncbi:MAG: DUF2878 domain-containing protein [Sedimentisphaerales bacterium]|nr:DUF2878 domain-containing protein [Sedimentisphaerales bacterium]